MKILLENSSYHLWNLGDVAMIQSAVIRLRSLFPDAEIFVPTTNLPRIAEVLPDATPIDVTEHYGPLVRPKSRVLRKLDYVFRPRDLVSLPPRFFVPPHVKQVRKALFESDIVMSSGGGFLCDSFSDHARSVLSTLRKAKSKGKTVGMVGQGVGPIANPNLFFEVKGTVRDFDFFYERAKDEKSPGFLNLGVPTLGDDALEVAYQIDIPRLSDRGSIGVNLRNTSYTKFDNVASIKFAQTLISWSKTHKSRLQPLPIEHLDDMDMKSVESIFGDSLDDFWSVTDIRSLLGAVDLCRFSVVMSYHSAIFSLARGVPVVCLSTSAYYDSKFQGILNIYGDRMVKVVNPSSLSMGAIQQILADAEETSIEDRQAAISLSKSLCDRQRQFLKNALTL